MQDEFSVEQLKNIDEFILLEDSVQQKSLLFVDKVETVLCTEPSELLICLDRLEILRQQGFYLAGFVSYEAGYVLQELPCIKTDFPLLHFIAYKTCCIASPVLGVQADLADKLQEVRLDITDQQYQHHFFNIKQAIITGQTYQVNYTSKYRFAYSGEPIALYMQLRERQKVPYAGLLQFPQYQILTHSPELFFQKKADTLRVQPMKGTMPRDLCPEQDERNKQFLTTDPKSRAENTMIVDLLRNDLSAISCPGTVKVLSLLDIVSYPTLHQMTSTIESRIHPSLTFKAILMHLFPCGSITGAPKRSTMEIIAQHEKHPRNIYTGAIGYITPENDMVFNVAIRTILLRNQKGELGVGGGLVYDSDVTQEFLEMQLKAQFFMKTIQQ